MTASVAGGLSWPRLLALSGACSLTVSVIYIPQSLLTSIAGDLGVSHGLASVLAMIAQVGYAVGIFGGRVLASLCTEWIGWRGTVFVTALAVAATIPSTRWALRHAPAPEGGALTHGRLVLATLRRALSNPILVRSALTQACVLATFNALWTVMVLHLTGPELSWTLGQAGLFGLVGLVAGFFTPYAGRLIDRHGARRMTGWFLLVLLTAMMAILLTNSTPVAFGAVMFVATWANQSALSGNQVRALATDPERSAQLNTVFSFIVFLGGGIGGLLGPLMYAWRGIDAVATVGVVLVLVAIAQWWLIPRAVVDRSQFPQLNGV